MTVGNSFSGPATLTGPATIELVSGSAFAHSYVIPPLDGNGNPGFVIRFSKYFLWFADIPALDTIANNGATNSTVFTVSGITGGQTNLNGTTIIFGDGFAHGGGVPCQGGTFWDTFVGGFGYIQNVVPGITINWN